MALEGVPDEGTLVYGVSWSGMEALASGLEKAAHYLVSGLLVDGAHHKQWCIEQALTALGVDMAKLTRQLRGCDCHYEEGIVP